MIAENKNIDQLFREKLGDYEKTPPTFLWTNIQERLHARRRKQLIVILKAVGIAAAIVLAFLAGWWMTNPADKGVVQQNNVAEQRIINSNVHPLTKNDIITIDKQPVNTIKLTSNSSSLSTKGNDSIISNATSLNTFAANTSITIKNHQLTTPKSGEHVLFDTPKDIPDKFQHDFKDAKKSTDSIAPPASKDSISVVRSDSKSLVIHHFKQIGSEKSVTIAMNNPYKNNNGRWSLKAELAPVFNGQSQNGGQGSKSFFSSSQNTTPQKSISENTFSGGIVAGYKVGKRFTVRSGLVYNNIRQTTSNVDFIGVNPLYNVPGNATIAATPAGEVSLNKMTNTRIGIVLDSKVLLNNTSNYLGGNVLKQNIEFIGIPVQATYKLIDRKFGIGLTGGISTNILVGNKAILSGNGEWTSSGQTSNMRNIVYSGAVGLEIGYEINNRITLTIEPRLKYFINSLSTNKSVDYKPNQVEIATGLTYSFN